MPKLKQLCPDAFQCRDRVIIDEKRHLANLCECLLDSAAILPVKAAGPELHLIDSAPGANDSTQQGLARHLQGKNGDRLSPLSTVMSDIQCKRGFALRGPRCQDHQFALMEAECQLV